MNSLINITRGSIAPLLVTANYYTSLPSGFSLRKKLKKFGPNMTPELLSEFYESLYKGKCKKIGQTSLFFKEDGTPVISKSLKKAKHAHKRHRHASPSPVSKIHRKHIRDRFKKLVQAKVAPSKPSSSARKLAKKLSKRKKHIISTTPVSKQNVSGKKVNKKMDKIAKKSSSTNKPYRKMNKRNRRTPKKVHGAKKVPPQIVDKVIQKYTKKTGKKPQPDEIRNLIAQTIRARTNPRAGARFLKKHFSKSAKRIQEIINKTLTKPKFSIQILKRAPNDKEKAINRQYHNLETQTLRGIRPTRNSLQKETLKNNPKQNINSLKPPSSQWWKDIFTKNI